MNTIHSAFAFFGYLSFALFIVGIALDVSDFDNTQGGYEAPYTDFTGKPVDWLLMDKTPTGLVKRGHIINVHVNGTTGMISFEIFRHSVNFRPFSERALIVHRPREALAAMGFQPQF